MDVWAIFGAVPSGRRGYPRASSQLRPCTSIAQSPACATGITPPSASARCELVVLPVPDALCSPEELTAHVLYHRLAGSRPPSSARVSSWSPEWRTAIEPQQQQVPKERKLLGELGVHATSPAPDADDRASIMTPARPSASSTLWFQLAVLLGVTESSPALRLTASGKGGSGKAGAGSACREASWPVVMARAITGSSWSRRRRAASGTGGRTRGKLNSADRARCRPTVAARRPTAPTWRCKATGWLEASAGPPRRPEGLAGCPAWRPVPVPPPRAGHTALTTSCSSPRTRWSG